LGYEGLKANTTGASNTAVGRNALLANTTGANNTSVGKGSGVSIQTGSSNTIVGADSDCAHDTANCIVLGVNIPGTDNVFRFGKLDNYAASTSFTNSGSATFAFASDRRKKQNIVDETLGLEFINKLKPRTFNWKPSNEYPKEWDSYSETNTVDTEKTHHGFIAQEVKAVLDEYGVSESIDVWAEDEDGMQRVSETKFVTQLIKAVQQLSAQVDALTARITTLEG